MKKLFYIALLLLVTSPAKADGYGCVEANKMELGALIQLYTTYARQSLNLSKYKGFENPSTDRELMFNDCLVVIADRIVGTQEKRGLDTASYKKALEVINKKSKSDPDPMAILAMNLQARWEDLYLVKFFQVVQNRAGYQLASRYLGYSTGLLASARFLGAPLSRVRGYFSLFSGMFGIQTAYNALGNKLGEVMQEVAASYKMPPPPAALLHLGFNLKQAGISDALHSQLFRDTLSDQARFISDGVFITSSNKLLISPGFSIQGKIIGWVATLGLTYLVGNEVKSNVEDWARATRLNNISNHLHDRIKQLRYEKAAVLPNRHRILELAKKIGDYANLIESESNLQFLNLLVASEIARSKSSSIYHGKIEEYVTEEIKKIPDYAKGTHPSVIREIARNELRSFKFTATEFREHKSEILSAVGKTKNSEVVRIDMKRLVNSFASSKKTEFQSFLDQSEATDDYLFAQELEHAPPKQRPDIMYRQLLALFRSSNDPILKRMAEGGFSARMKQYFVFYGGR